MSLADDANLVVRSNLNVIESANLRTGNVVTLEPSGLPMNNIKGDIQTAGGMWYLAIVDNALPPPSAGWVRIDFNPGSLNFWTEGTGITPGNEYSSFTPFNAAANVNAIIIPKGNGSFQTSLTGNSRGIYAVDLQMNRISASEVASGDYSFIGSGQRNTASGDYSAIIAGLNNEVSGQYSGIISGQNNLVSSTYSTICGGENNQIVGDFSTICGGTGNRVLKPVGFCAGGSDNIVNSFSFIGVGQNNEVDGDFSFIGAGSTNKINDIFNAVICGGQNNIAGAGTNVGDNSMIGAGDSNLVSQDNAFIGAGNNNIASATNTFIGSGSTNTASGTSSAVAAGNSNQASGTGSFIGAGDTNTVSGNNSTIIGGANNNVSGNSSFIGGGLNNQTANDFATIGGGNSNSATNDFATIGGGNSNQASGIYSTIGGGNSNQATGQNSTIGGGILNMATGSYSTIGGGRSNVASASDSTVAGGESNSALGSNSTIGGGVNNIIRSGISSTIAGGSDNEINNGVDYAFCAGQGLNLTADYTSAVGRFNEPGGHGTPTSERIFMVGNGTSDLLRNNAFSVTQNGKCFAEGSLNNGGADFAEWFESSLTENIALGTAVVMENSKIRPAKTGEIPFGVISTNPAFVGNSGEEKWSDKYIRDSLGNIIMEEITVEEEEDVMIEETITISKPVKIRENGKVFYKMVKTTETIKKPIMMEYELRDDDGNKVKTISRPRTQMVKKTIKQKKLNPTFNPELKYIPRSQRPEWNIVGLLGQIPVLKGQPLNPKWQPIKEINEKYTLMFITS